jgi:hypothetical protein
MALEDNISKEIILQSQIEQLKIKQMETIKTIEEIENQLKAPMNYKWRIQSINDYKATCVAYIDARDVMDRLDEVFGVHGWEDEYEEADGKLFCKLSCHFPNKQFPITKSDTGSESNVEKDKGLASDTFKRAAVKFGVGRFLYNLGIEDLKVKKHTNGKNYPVDSKGNILWTSVELNDYVNSKNK